MRTFPSGIFQFNLLFGCSGLPEAAPDCLYCIIPTKKFPGHNLTQETGVPISLSKKYRVGALLLIKPNPQINLL